MSESDPSSRRRFLALAAVGSAAAVAPAGAVVAADRMERVARILTEADPADITVETIRAAELIAGVSFTDEQRELMLEDLKGRLEDLATLRTFPLPNSVVPSIVFDPRVGGERPRRWTADPGFSEIDPLTAMPIQGASSPDMAVAGGRVRPSTGEDLAYGSVAELSHLLRTRLVTSVELTELYLERLQRYDEVLHAVVTLTPDRALAQAEAADAELDAGLWRGPLHGVPWGAKDLLSVRGYPTTWGAMPYRDQVLDVDAAVVERLDAAGAVLVAKLTLGALAMGDVWFGGRTRNPWNVDQGSSGSSAGPGSAVSAGLVAFGIGSETLGSIVSPSTRNGVTGFRPSYGLVSRHGAMALSWTMDKLGPMARSAHDCELVFRAIVGYDERDPATVEAGFEWNVRPDPGLTRVGYLSDAFPDDDRGAADRAVLDTLRSLGYDPQPVALPDLPVGAIRMMLTAEAAAAFAGLSDSGGTDTMVSQGRGSWPNTFRHGRFIPAVDYINASRIRTLLSREMATLMKDWDVIVTPSFGGTSLTLTNLSGHPSVTVPNRFDLLEDDPDSPRRRPGSITFLGGLYRDDSVLAVARHYQSVTDFHRRRPPIA